MGAIGLVAPCAGLGCGTRPMHVMRLPRRRSAGYTEQPTMRITIVRRITVRPNMEREALKPELLVVGAGASIQEYLVNGSGKPPGFPSVNNFCSKLFQDSPPLQWATAVYLNYVGVPFDDYILRIY